MDKQNRKVPARVLKTLKSVRDRGFVNMFDKKGVCLYCDLVDHKSGSWMYKFCGGKCDTAYENYSAVLDQFSEYLKGKDNEIRNTKTG